MTSLARSTLWARLRALREAVDNPAFVTAGLMGVAADASALLRNGLAVQSFAVLEEFILTRSREALQHISAGYGAWNDLPPALLKRTTLGVASLLGAEANRLQRNVGSAAAMTLLEDTGASWATRRSGTMHLPDLAFGWSGSNMQAQDLADILSCLTVEKPFEAMTSILKRSDFPLVATSKDLLSALARNRHQAAHIPSHGIAPVALRAMPNEVLALSFAFDALVSRAAALGHAFDSHFQQGKGLKTANIGIRVVTKQTGETWRELKVGGQRGNRHVGSLADVKAKLLVDRSNTGDALLFREKDGAVVDWTTTDLP